MKFENALSKMREGAKIRIRFMPEDEYYQACKIGLAPELKELEKDSEIKDWLDNQPLSIVWMKGNRQHPDMMPKYNPPGVKTFQCKHGMFPMINLLWLMSHEWEIIL